MFLVQNINFALYKMNVLGCLILLREQIDFTHISIKTLLLFQYQTHNHDVHDINFL